MPRERLALFVALLIASTLTTVHGRQAPAARSPDPLATAVAAAARTTGPAERPAVLVYANRRIVTLRATVMSRPPDLRAAAAVDVLQRLVRNATTASSSVRLYPDAAVIELGDQPIIALFAADIDPLQGEDLVRTAQSAATRLQRAFDESVELHARRRLARAAGIALAVMALYLFAVWLLVRINRRVASHISGAARRLRSLPAGDAPVDGSATRRRAGEGVYGSTAAPRIVPPDDWYAPPAVPQGDPTARGVPVSADRKVAGA